MFRRAARTQLVAFGAPAPPEAAIGEAASQGVFKDVRDVPADEIAREVAKIYGG